MCIHYQGHFKCLEQYIKLTLSWANIWQPPSGGGSEVNYHNIDWQY